MINKNIDGGREFDWGRTSADYARYRDIYPEEFYQRLYALGVGAAGQRVLDIGTGTGVVPRNMYRYGARFVGTDISQAQIEQARRLARDGGMDIDFLCCPTEKLDFPAGSFDAVTACQCFFYFDHGVTAPLLAGLLKSGGKLAVLYMAWLPYEDKVAAATEELVLRYNPRWSGAGATRQEVYVPPEYGEYFNIVHSEIFDTVVNFTRESWNGRIRACRGIGASLSDDEVADFEREHLVLLRKIAPEEFGVLHCCSLCLLEKK